MLTTRPVLASLARRALHRPAPPPLPRDQQREFEALQRTAPVPATIPIQRDFDGDVNPRTGEQGGPKTEPVQKYVEHDHGDWSFKGRVSDF